MKIVVISDTHGQHERLGRLSGDVLIHCGDTTNLFRPDPLAIGRLDRWFGQQDFAHILCIGGNHDLELERLSRAGKAPFRNARFLHEETCVIDGVRFYGASWVPKLKNHAFFATEDELSRAWDRIPEDVDVLITHTPPAGMRDRSGGGISRGCPLLARRVLRLRPALHCFGHVHDSAGQSRSRGVTFVNASCFTNNPETDFRPVRIDLNHGRAPRNTGFLERMRALWPF